MKIDKKSATVGAAVAVAALAIALPRIADAAGATPSPSPNAGRVAPVGGRGFGHFGSEAELTGATADKVKAAVLAKLPGATIERMSSEDSREGTGAAYEAHVTKSDGTRVEVLIDKSFAVTAVNADRRGGFRDHGGAPGEGGGAPGTTNNGTSGGGDLGATDAVLYTA